MASGTGRFSEAAQAAGLPSSCAQLHAISGTHTIFVGYEPVQVSCVATSGDPATYLRLHETGGASNYSYQQSGGWWWWPSSRTQFAEVRLLGHGDSLNGATCTVLACIYTSDTAFSSTSGFTPQPFAQASACNWWGAPGTANVDLQGTGVKVTPNAFTYDAWAPSVQQLQYSDNNEVVNMAADGQCGGYAPTTAPLLPVQPLWGPGSQA